MYYDFVFYGALSSRDNATITLNTGETCPIMVRTTCGIPTYIPSNTVGFDIESVDYNSDEATGLLRFLQALPPPPPPSPPAPTPTPTPAPTTTPANTRKRLGKTQKLNRRGFQTQVVDGVAQVYEASASTTGPVASRYRPDFDNGKKKFKTGFRAADDLTCETRYSLVFITSLRGLSVNVTSDIANNYKRDLQAVPPSPPPATPTTVSNSMTISFGAEDFSGAASLFVSFFALACSVFMMF